MSQLRNHIKLTFLLLFTVIFNNFSQTSDLIISEYSEGSSNNKYVEIFNGTGASVDLSNYQIWRISNGGSWPEATASMSGTLNDGDVYVVYNGSSDQTIVASGDLSSGVVSWNGDDAVGLAKDISGTMTLIDAIGEDGSDPGTGWSVAGTSNGTANRTLVRKPDICSPNTNWTTSSGTNTTDSEWTVYAQNTWSYIGSHSSNCSSSSATTPAAPTISSIDNGEGQVTVNFTAGSDGGATITDFEYSIDNGSTFTSMGTTSSPYIISGLTNGTDYNIQIRAVNSEGAGTASSTAVGSPFTNELTLSAFNSATLENFNSLASSGTSSTLPTGIYLDESGSNANSTYSTSTGSSTSGNTYSFGSDNDRALGGVASGALQTSFGAKIRNETGTTLNAVVISYIGESWRIGSANRIDQLDFQYSTDATGLDDGTWTDFDNLDYVNTGQATGSGSIQHTSSLNDTLTNLGVSNNGTFWIRWNDLNATGADDGMAIDDLSITAICKAGTVAVSDDYILAGNNITWTYTGSDFDSYEYQWNSDGWNAPWTTNNPQTWGAGWTGNIGQTLYVRAKAVCGSESDLSSVVSTYWDNCYAEPITATVDGVSISNGGDFTINSTVAWTWEHAGSGESHGAPDEGGGSGHALGYAWETAPSINEDYLYVWNTNPQSWDGPSNPTQFSSTDRILYVKSRATGVSSCTNYSQPFSITLKRPVISISGALSDFTVCAGTASSSQSFSVSGNYVSNSTGITVTAPAGFEVSTDDSNFSGSVNVSASSGNVSSTPIYVRLASTASGSPSGNVTCSATSAVDQTVSASGTATAAPDAGTLSGTEAVCSDGTTDFDTDGDSGGTWSSADDNVATINSASGVVSAVATGSSLMTYTVSGTGACAGTDASSTRTVTVNAAATGGSLTVDKTEALSTETINWTNSGVTNGTCRYHFQWSDDNISAPTGSWTPWDITENQSWATSSAGSNMNRTLWVKTIITASNAGCSNVETTPVYTDVVNCKAGTTSASVSAGAVAHMPFGETITYTSGAPLDGSFERLQFQWGGTSGAWSDWSTNNPTNYTTDINAGQTLYVRAKITGADVGSGGCTDYSNIIQTLLVDCPNAVSANAGSDIDLCSGSTTDFLGSGSGSTSGSNVSSYAWSPNTEISSTSSATPTVSATSTRTYTLTNTHDNGCTSTDDIIVTVADSPSITTGTDLTAAANTCGETELTISHSGTGGNGQWTYSGGLVSYNNSNATDATINVTAQPSDVNTDITMTWTVGAGEVCDGAIATKTIRFNQPTSISSPDTYCYLWGGLTSADNATGSNWYKWDATKSMWARQSTAPSTSTDKLHVLTTDNNCIHASNTMTLGTTTLASLNVGSGATMNLGSGTVTLNGDLTNEGTINEGTGTVSLTAAGDQTLSGGGTTNFNNLTLNKTSDNLVLSSSATIKGTLTMNKGNINNGSNILTIGESSASPGAITHNSGSVTGKLRRYFADASSSSKFFPIGNASTTRDVTVSFGSTPGSNQFLTASYNAGYPQLSGEDLYAGLPLTTADGQLIQNYDDEGYWEINPGSTATGTADSYSADINSAAYNLTIHMNGLTGANSASMDRTKVRIIKSAGPSHTSWVALTHGSISGSADSDYTVTASGSGFSFFGAGTDDGNALPVELVSFNGVCNDGVVDLVWQTASEQNSEDFEVAYSRDGVDWKTVHTEPAPGFSNTLITYNYTHEGAVSGNNYYRLTQNDIDGASVVYDNMILNANCQTSSEGYFSVYPNPSSGSFSIVSNIIDSENAAQIKILDTKGNLIFTKSLTVFKGINIHSVQLNLKPGIYYLKFESENGISRSKKLSIY